jgi:hypothetical protein
MNVTIERIDLDLWKSSNLTFRDDGPVKPGAKTRVFSIFNSSNKSLLGYIKWFPNWRKYCFYPLNSLFDDKCLDQVSTFMKEATAAHKSRLPNIKRQRDMMLARRERKIERLTKQREAATMGNESEGQVEPAPERKNQVVEGDHD